MKTISLIFSAIFDLIIRYLPQFKRRDGFAFLVHPRDISDVYRKYPFLKYLPQKMVESIIMLMWPVTLGKVKGLISKKTGLGVDGYIIGITMPANEILKDRKRAIKKIKNATKLAKKKGANIIGLGSLSSPVMNGGIDLAGKYGVFVTNGNALTAGVTLLGIKKIAEKRKITLSQSTIAIVGATGSVGQAVAKLLIRDCFVTNMVIIGRTPSNIAALTEELKKINGKINIVQSTKISDIKYSDIIVTATSSSEVLIESKFLKKGAVIYDVTQPQNVSKSIKEERKDVLVIDGGIVKLPKNITYNLNMGIPKGTAFACFSETMLLGAEGVDEDFSIGKVKLKQVDYILKIAQKYGFKLAPLTSWGELIT